MKRTILFWIGISIWLAIPTLFVCYKLNAQSSRNQFPSTPLNATSITYTYGGTNITVIGTNSCLTITTPNTNVYVITQATNNPVLVGTYTQDMSRFPNGSGCYYYTNTGSNGYTFSVDGGLVCNLVNNYEVQDLSLHCFYNLTLAQLTPFAPPNPDIWSSNGAASVKVLGTWATNYTTNCSAFLVSSVVPFNTNLIWMDPNGNDYNGQRGRPDLPFQHLYNVMTQMVAGDTLFVNPGNYTESQVYVQQLPRNVHIIGPGADTAKIQMTLGNGTSYLYMGDSNTISGLWLTNYVLQPGNKPGGPASPTTNNIIKDMRITSAGDCIIFGHDGCWNPVVINCYLDGGSDKLADFTDGTSPGWVTSSTIYVSGGRLSGGVGANGFGWTTGKERRWISCLGLDLTGLSVGCYSYGLNNDFYGGTNGYGGASITGFIPSTANGKGTNTIFANTGGPIWFNRDTNGANNIQPLTVWSNISDGVTWGQVNPDSSFSWSNNINIGGVASFSNKLGAIFNKSLTIRSNTFPLVSFTDVGAGSACFFWLSNASLYLICTNSINLNCTTNKIGGL